LTVGSMRKTTPDAVGRCCASRWERRRGCPGKSTSCTFFSGIEAELGVIDVCVGGAVP
jgi:hypothetical protein